MNFPLSSCFDICLIPQSFEECLEEIPKEPIPIFTENNHQIIWYLSVDAERNLTLEERLFGRVRNDCEPWGYNRPPFQVIPQSYFSGAFVLSGIDSHDICNPDVPKWVFRKDTHHPLWVCLNISRLVHPTPADWKYIARCLIEGNHIKKVFPLGACGWSAEAYLPIPKEEASRWRTWFTPDELKEIGLLLRRFIQTGLPDRLISAQWFYCFAFSTNYSTLRWLLLSQALQAIVCTEVEHSRKQFLSRLPILAEQCSIQLTRKEAEKIWGFRCQVTHGTRITNMSPEDLPLLRKAEDLLRSAIKKALLDEEWSSVWGNKENIERNWPVD